MELTSSKKENAVALHDIKITGVEFLQIRQIEINHVANEFARARLILQVDDKKGKKFLEQANADKIKISAKINKKDTVLFQG